MTQDAQIILKGLNCCAKTNPLCEECPYTEKEIQCRELESDAAELIKSLLSRIEDQDETIYKLEERLGMMNE